MAVPGGKSVGRLSVRVVPDSSKLREDLKKVFARIERTMQINVRVEGNTDPAERAMRRFTDAYDGMSLTANLDADTGAARAKLAAISRPRHVSLLPEVSKTASAKALSALAALSGGRVLQDRLRGIGEALGSLDRNLPRISAVALTVANLGSVLLASTSGLAGLATSLVTVAGAGIAIPGILGGIAAGAGVMVAALVDTSTQLAVLKPKFTALQDVISAEFWSKARAPIIELARSLLPDLRAGSEGVAASLGNWTASLAGSLQGAFGDGRILTMFQSLATAIDTSASSAGALSGIVATLGTVGAQYLPQLAASLGEVTTKFDGFLTAAAGDGRLQGWIDAGIIAGQQLAGIFVNLGQILGGVAQAAGNAGAGGLGTVNKVLGAIAEIVSQPVFQTALTTLFEGATAGIFALGQALGPIGDLFATLAPTLAGVMTTAGSALGGLLSSIADALAQPAFAAGLTGLFDGLAVGIAGLAPAMGPIASALGSLGSLAGQLAASFGPLIGETLALLAPILTDVFTALQPLIPVLGGLLTDAIRTVAPWIGTIVNTLLPPLVDVVIAVAEALGPLLDALAPLTPVFATIAENIASFLPVIGELVSTVIAQLVALIPPIVDALLSWFDAMAPLIPAIGDLLVSLIPLGTSILPIVAAILPDLVGLFQQVLAAVQPNIPAFVQLLGSLTEMATAMAPLITAMLPILIELVRLVLTPILTLASGITQRLAPAFERGAEVVTAIADKISEFASKATAMKDTVSGVASAVAGAISGLRDKLTADLAAAGDWLVDSGKAIIDGLIEGISSRVGKAVGAVSGALSDIRDLFPFSPAKKGPFSGSGWVLYSGRSIGTAFAKGIRDNTDQVRSAALAMATTAHTSSSLTAAAVTAYQGSAATTATGTAATAAGVTVAMSGNFYSYDPTDLAAAAARRAQDAQAVAGLRRLTGGAS